TPELIDGSQELDVLRAREGGIGGEDAIGLFGSLADEVGVDVSEIDDAQLRNTMLSRAEEFAGTADLKVAFRQLESVDRPAVLFLHHRREPLGIGRFAHEHAIRPLGAAAHATAKLMELREAEALGAKDDHARGVRSVYPDVGHRRRRRAVDLTAR